MSTSALAAVELCTRAVIPTDPPTGMVAWSADDVAAKLGPGTGVGAAVGVVAGVGVAPPVVPDGVVGVAFAPAGGVGVGALVGTAAAATENFDAPLFAPKNNFQPSA